MRITIIPVAAALAISLPALAHAAPVAISWSAADQQFRRSAEVSAADHAANSAKLTAESLRTLRRPTVSLSAQLVTYQKTLSVDLSGLKGKTQQQIGTYLNALPGQFPPDLQGIVQLVTQRVDAALPGLLDEIPENLDYRTRDTLFRPTATAFVPLYTGGAIGAIQRGAGAAATAARAKADADINLARVNLARAYFGVTLADGLVAAARDDLAAMDRHLANTQAFFRNGVLPRSKVLEVQVVRDAAARTLDRATIDRDRAIAVLRLLLESEADLVPSTGLFVHDRPLSPAGDYIASAANPRVREAEATREVASAGVKLAKSRLLPQAYAFGEYSFDRKSAAPTEPDWIAGVGARWTLLSPVDRLKAIAAAKEREAAASDAVTVTRKAVATEITDAWALAEGARRSFLSLDSSVAAANENLRVAEIAYREGEGTTTQVIDARTRLTNVRTQRLATAYEYAVSLAALLAASGRMNDFDAAVATADRRIRS
ncbi:TolC family protein [Sphingomonas astaxanthinifaciens]|uniref:Outer membrane protein TolC n=1 Tax=Sphingomonas astaxanthinifaciens DSM 22298 TaxID=1123267 RepID=A0ABQ5ZA32_9SPHN|nr:TolC family protein [Sphingomonas astaxanthinifaciens]GLR48341.1 hypothetical protein GCM10007925_20560 [Sphingomonas astaxanthinifaciens DSM 22298]